MGVLTFFLPYNPNPWPASIANLSNGIQLRFGRFSFNSGLYFQKLRRLKL